MSGCHFDRRTLLTVAASAGADACSWVGIRDNVSLVRSGWDEAKLGLVKGTVRVVDSQPAWSTVYEQLASALRPAMGALAVAIEHIGSTSVPGLAA